MAHIVVLGALEGAPDLEVMLRASGHAVTVLNEEEARRNGRNGRSTELSVVETKPFLRGEAPPRRYRMGERIELGSESTLEVHCGVVAQTVLHEDGDEVLLGLYGAGQLLAVHPDDGCCLEIHAHTDVTVAMRSWRDSLQRPDLAERLREQLRLLEAWASMQARPQLEQRLVGILSLLAERFGRPTPQGRLVGVRITHAQLAAAIGATRTSVTRLLGALRRKGVLASVRERDGERFCLPGFVSHGHGAVSAVGHRK